MIYDGEEVRLSFKYYKNSKYLRVELFNKYSIETVVSKFLRNSILTNSRCAFVDTNNNPNIENFLAKYRIAKPTGKTIKMGMCVYPEYEFNTQLIDKYWDNYFQIC